MRIIPGGQPNERMGSKTQRIGTHQHFVWLGGIVRAVIVLNVLDAVLTLVWVYTGQATEANPMMEVLVHEHPALFVVVKFTLVFFGTWLLWRQRKRATAVVAIFGAFLVYYALLLYHLSWLNLRLLRRFFD